MRYEPQRRRHAHGSSFHLILLAFRANDVGPRRTCNQLKSEATSYRSNQADARSAPNEKLIAPTEAASAMTVPCDRKPLCTAIRSSRIRCSWHQEVVIRCPVCPVSVPFMAHFKLGLRKHSSPNWRVWHDCGTFGSSHRLRSRSAKTTGTFPSSEPNEPFMSHFRVHGVKQSVVTANLD